MTSEMVSVAKQRITVYGVDEMRVSNQPGHW